MGIIKNMTAADSMEQLAKMKAKAEEFRRMFVNAPRPAPKTTMTYEEAKAKVAALRNR